MPRRSPSYWPILVALWGGMLSSSAAFAQKRIACEDGEHLEIDVGELAIEYQATGFGATLSGLGVLSGRIGVEPKQIQRAEAATQVWNEYLKALAAGYNRCAITKRQYAEGLQRIYPRLQEDAADLEAIRLVLREGQEIDQARLRRVLDSYFTNLRQFADLSGQPERFERIEQVVNRTETNLLEGQADILAKVEQLEQAVARLTKPEEVTSKIGQRLAERAEAAYGRGYELLQRFAFAEAIPYLEEEVATVPLGDFYFALGTAYLELPNLPEAERVLRDGVARAEAEGDEELIAALSSQLGRTLLARGALEEALEVSQRALRIDSLVYGPDHPKVAIDANNIGQILLAQGDLAGALTYAERALRIFEATFGKDHPSTRVVARNLEGIKDAIR